MRSCGTQVVAGIAPGGGGRVVRGVPVFNAVSEAMRHARAKHGVDIDASVILLPPRHVRRGAIDAIEAGVRQVYVVSGGVPAWDVMEIATAARARGAELIGPGTCGAISPGRSAAGVMGSGAGGSDAWFSPGAVGVISRSSGMCPPIARGLCRAGIGMSTVCHVGTGFIVGLRLADLALRFERDPETRAIVLFGEIGGTQEEELGELMRAGRVTKPVVGYVAGGAVRAGFRFTHSSAIIERGRGTRAGKVRVLREGGAIIVDTLRELPAAVGRALDA